MTTAPQMPASTNAWMHEVTSMTLRFEKRSLTHPVKGANKIMGSAIINPARDGTSNSTLEPSGISRVNANAPPSGMSVNCAILSLNAF